ncbi:unnamed protein product [Caenorhabditis bovis]|uniref:Ig-like domain-containing protein n=1 Tax=Caenorhabditis bovis TaxID=2654633 RepID=A0A8S1EXN9_9PELO|nr:unnamed protein product [Caenorhabditis bovis]
MGKPIEGNMSENLKIILIAVLCQQVIGSTSRHENVDELDFTDHSNGSPHILRHSYFKQDFRLGYKLKLFCEAIGAPRPEITWYHRGVEVNLDTNKTVRQTMHGNSMSSYLEVDPTSVTDKGEYECVATNAKGSHVKKFLTNYQY